MRRTVVALMFISALTSIALADIAKPSKTPKQKAAIDTILRINLKSDAKEAKLIIPKSQLMQLRAQLDQLGEGNDATAAITTSGNGARIPTIVGGLFLSLAIVFGGIWFARSGKISPKTSQALVLITIIAAVGSAATFVYGNAGPPAEARSITGKMFAPGVHIYGFGYGNIKLETTNTDEDNQAVVLIVPDPKDTPNADE
jgi:hypothetical protein